MRVLKTILSIGLKSRFKSTRERITYRGIRDFGDRLVVDAGNEPNMSCGITFILRIHKVLYYSFDVVAIWMHNVKSFETWITVSLFLDVVHACDTVRIIDDFGGQYL